MVWQTYLDERLMCEIDGPGPRGRHLSAAAILSHDGSVLAKSLAFPQLIPEEIQSIMMEFEEPGHLATAALGLSLGGIKYTVIRGEPKLVIRAVKGYKGHSEGVCIMKTKQCLLIGFYDDSSLLAAQCSGLVEGLGDHLLNGGL